jgi:hypothetical protein
VDVADCEGEPFDLWAIVGAKRLLHDGADLGLACRRPSGGFRATLGRGLEVGRPFAVWPSAGGAAPIQESTGACSRAGARPADRSRLAHLRALLALDAKAQGASDLQIARAFTPAEQLASAWSADSAARALVRDALKRGRAFRDGRWRELVWAPGDERLRSNLPAAPAGARPPCLPSAAPRPGAARSGDMACPSPPRASAATSTTVKPPPS